MANDANMRVNVIGDYDGADKIEKASKDVENLGKSVSSTGNKLSGGTNSIRSFVNSFSDVNSALNTASRKWNYTFRSFNRTLVNGLKDAGREIKDFTKEAIDNYTKLTEQHAKTTGAMYNNYPNTTSGKKQFAQDSSNLEKQAINLAKYGTTGNGSLYTSDKVSEAQTELVKAGVPTKSILNDGVLENILTFAQANDLETSNAVEFAVALGNQFNVKYKDWGSMLDKVSHTADLSTIDVSDVVQSMKYAGGVTSGLNRSMDEVLGMIAEMGNFGLKGSQSGSSIQALYTRLLTGDTTVITDRQKEVAPPKALKAFYDFSKYAKSDGSGLTYDQIKNGDYKSLGKLSGNLRPMSEVVDKLDEVMGDLNDEEQAWFAKKFFGLYQMKGAYALTNGENSDQVFQDYEKRIKEESAGTNKNKLDQLLNSQYGQTTTLANMWDTVKTDIGSDMSPLVSAVRDELYNFLKNDGNYEIDINSIKDALEECTNTIGDKYGEAIGDAANTIGNTVIDLSYVAKELSPEFANGIADMLNKFADGDIGGMFEAWGDMIDNMDESVEDLPENLQAMGDKVVGVIDMLGKLAAFNIGAKIVEGLTSVIKAITIAGGAIIKAGSVIVNGGTGKGTTGGGTVNGGGSSGGSKNGTNTTTTTRGQKITNATKFVAGTAGGVFGSYVGGEFGSDIVEQFGGDESQQDTGRFIGTVVGAGAGAKLGSWTAGKVISAASKYALPVVKSAGESAYLYGLYGLDALSANALVGGTAGSSAAAVAGSLALPATAVGGSLWMMYDQYTTTKKQDKARQDIADMDDDEHPLWDKDGNLMYNADGSVKSSKDLAIDGWGPTRSEYAYGGAFDENDRHEYEQDEPEDPFRWYNPLTWFGSDEYDEKLEAYRKKKEETKKRENEEEDYFYKIQDELYKRSGIYLKDEYFSKDNNENKLMEWYKSLGTENEIDFSLLDLGKDRNGRDIAKKFTKMSDEWAYEYMSQMKDMYGGKGLTLDISNFKPSDILKGTEDNKLNSKDKKNSKLNKTEDEKNNIVSSNAQKYVSNNLKPDETTSMQVAHNISTALHEKFGLYESKKSFYYDLPKELGFTGKEFLNDTNGEKDNSSTSSVVSQNKEKNNPSISNTINSISNKLSNLSNNDLIDSEVQKTIQVNDNSSINIQPITTPVTVQPNINVDVHVDKDGKVTLTKSQINSLFNLGTEFNVSKSRSYNTGGASNKTKG